MTAYILKLVAIITMTIDHAGYLIYGHLSWMNVIGRIAFPIFAFQISEGFFRTHNLKKYILRLTIFALISQIPYSWFCNMFFSSSSLNIIFTLILGILSICIYDYMIKLSKNKKGDISSYYKLSAFMIVIIISFFADKLNFDYGYYGVFLIFLFYLFHNNKKLMNISVIALTTLYYIPFWLVSNFSILYFISFFFSLVPLIFINMYNGQKGKKFKLMFYIFYPVHLLVLCLITYLLRLI